jgi:hypothetical protein
MGGRSGNDEAMPFAVDRPVIGCHAWGMMFENNG